MKTLFHCTQYGVGANTASVFLLSIVAMTKLQVGSNRLVIFNEVYKLQCANVEDVQLHINAAAQQFINKITAQGGEIVSVSHSLAPLCRAPH